MTPEGRAFEVRRAEPPAAVVELARTLHDVHQRAFIMQHGRGEYVLWSFLPEPVKRAWCDLAEAALAHFASRPTPAGDSPTLGGIFG